MTMRNNKGFTLIELIMVTIILGILAAVAIPRYMATVNMAEEAAEDAVISSIKAGLETYAIEQLMDSGRRTWPDNPWSALETKPSGYTTDATNADVDGEWTYNTTTLKITHQRGDNTQVGWAYDKGTQSGGAADVGTLGTGVNL